MRVKKRFGRALFGIVSIIALFGTGKSCNYAKPKLKTADIAKKANLVNDDIDAVKQLIGDAVCHEIALLKEQPDALGEKQATTMKTYESTQKTLEAEIDKLKYAQDERGVVYYKTEVKDRKLKEEISSSKLADMQKEMSDRAERTERTVTSLQTDVDNKFTDIQRQLTLLGRRIGTKQGGNRSQGSKDQGENLLDLYDRITPNLIPKVKQGGV